MSRFNLFRFVFLPLFGVVVGFAWPRSAEATPAEAALAEKLFQEGREAMDREDYQDACSKFGESQRLDPGAGTLMNWASCEEKLGLVASAWQHWLEALSLLSPDDARVKYAQERAKTLEPDVPRLTLVVVDGAPKGTVLLLDDVELTSASLGSALPVDPGERQVTVQAPGHSDRTYRVTLPRGGNKTLKVAPGPEREESTDDTSGATSLAPFKWAALGVGALGIAGGVTTGLLAKNRHDTVNQNCADDFTCNSTGAQAAREGSTFVTLNTVSWAVAAVGIGAGITLWILDEGSETEAPENHAELSVTPTAGGAAVSYRGSF